MYQRIVIGGLILLHAATASGQAPATESPAIAPTPSAEQVLYRGVVGNLLETVPLDSKDRVQLQRASALVSTPFGARSLALALGIAQPPLLVAGVLWGIWSAMKIKPTETATQHAGPSTLQTAHVHGSNSGSHRGDIDTVETLETVPLGPLTRSATASTLAAMVGGSGPVVHPVPCQNCYMPILDSRGMTLPR